MNNINEIVKRSLVTYSQANKKQKAEMLDFLNRQVKEFDKYGTGEEPTIIKAAKLFINKIQQ